MAGNQEGPKKAFNGHHDRVRRRPFVPSGGDSDKRSPKDADMKPSRAFLIMQFDTLGPTDGRCCPPLRKAA